MDLCLEHLLCLCCCCNCAIQVEPALSDSLLNGSMRHVRRAPSSQGFMTGAFGRCDVMVGSNVEEGKEGVFAVPFISFVALVF